MEAIGMFLAMAEAIVVAAFKRARLVIVPAAGERGEEQASARIKLTEDCNVLVVLSNDLSNQQYDRLWRSHHFRWLQTQTQVLLAALVVTLALTQNLMEQGRAKELFEESEALLRRMQDAQNLEAAERVSQEVVLLIQRAESSPRVGG